MQRKYAVHVIRDFCKGCGICMVLCPAKILTLSKDFNKRGHHYVIAKENGCLGCRTCELTCPDFAIFIECLEENSEK
ncbi:hypothetical protein DRO02_05225 [archaeon]|nr:MAG: hypothetical protein DRO02_05225 [archaeon]RLG64882.1 MAG: hypothetical protein DRO21_03175 [archaeon]